MLCVCACVCALVKTEMEIELFSVSIHLDFVHSHKQVCTLSESGGDSDLTFLQSVNVRFCPEAGGPPPTLHDL